VSDTRPMRPLEPSMVGLAPGLAVPKKKWSSRRVVARGQASGKRSSGAVVSGPMCWV